MPEGSIIDASGNYFKEKKMKRRLIVGVVICFSIMTIFGCGSKNEMPKLTIDQNATNSIYSQIEVKDKEIEDDSKEKIETGIENWAKATIGIDDRYSVETKKITDEKLYNLIVSSEERNEIKKQRDEFYKDSKIQTDKITVKLKKANEAIYNDKSISCVETKVTIEGKRNDDSFKNTYDLVMLMDYQRDIASVYEIVDIKLK